MSTPAQKPRPLARRRATRLVGTRPTASSASASANQPATSSALTGGWSMTTSAIPSCSWITSMGMRSQDLLGLVPAPASESRRELTPGHGAGPTRRRRPGRSRPARAGGRRRRVCLVTQPVYDFSERVVVVTGGSRGGGAGLGAGVAPARGPVVAGGGPAGGGGGGGVWGGVRRGRGACRGVRAQRGRGGWGGLRHRRHPQAAGRRAGHRQGGR